MTMKAIQQFQLRAELGSEKQARNTLQLVREAGFEGIELNGFMIRKMPLSIRMLTRMAGMPIGASGGLDWYKLIKEVGLKVVSLHDHLEGILKDPDSVIADARSFNTDYVVITGLRKFDYSDENKVQELVEKLNRAGEIVSRSGIKLLYHNHNCEFREMQNGQTAFDLLIEKTDPQYVNFEFDSYWPIEAGCDAVSLMHQLGNRMKLYHINDRGTRVTGTTGSILKSDSMELGYGNVNLPKLVEIAKSYGVESIVLESHQNWIDKSAIKSFQRSAVFMNQYI